MGQKWRKMWLTAICGGATPGKLHGLWSMGGRSSGSSDRGLPLYHEPDLSCHRQPRYSNLSLRQGSHPRPSSTIRLSTQRQAFFTRFIPPTATKICCFLQFVLVKTKPDQSPPVFIVTESHRGRLGVLRGPSLLFSSCLHEALAQGIDGLIPAA